MSKPYKEKGKSMLSNLKQLLISTLKVTAIGHQICEVTCNLEVMDGCGNFEDKNSIL